jgi:glycerol-3-phosphate acyltransferase PlsX
MSKPRIAVDAMGGDRAPEEIVAGALLAANAYDLEIVLVGDQARIQPLLTGPAAAKIRVVHAPDAVPMDQHASQALRQADKTSLGIAVSMAKDGLVDAVVSAGNSGAFLAIALIKLRTIEGIGRPAIATVWPALNGPTVVLDGGANMDCRPEWLEQFGIMGAAYAKAVLHIENPRVATLSVGEERSKGNAVSLEAGKLLDTSPVNFIGNVEGRHLFQNVADVVVADGFVGNVVLKSAEGMISDLVNLIRDTVNAGNVWTKLGAALMAPALTKMRGNCIVAHGRASRIAIKNAIAAAAEEVRNDVVGKITEMMAAHEPIPIEREAAQSQS